MEVKRFIQEENQIFYCFMIFLDYAELIWTRKNNGLAFTNFLNIMKGIAQWFIFRFTTFLRILICLCQIFPTLSMKPLLVYMENFSELTFEWYSFNKLKINAWNPQMRRRLLQSKVRGIIHKKLFRNFTILSVQATISNYHHDVKS